jgi:hypothetical protein
MGARRVVGGNAIGNGYWYTLAPEGAEGAVEWGTPCSAADAAVILAEMQSIVQQARPICDEQVAYAEVMCPPT